MSKFTLLFDGDLLITERLKRQLMTSDFIIAVDNGIKHALPLRCVPDLWLGDFDSCEKKEYPQFQDVATQIYEKDKDKTDGALAVEEAQKRGAEELVIMGAFGGPRADHIFSHMAQAIICAQRSKILLTSGYCEMAPLALQSSEDPLAFDYGPGTLFSILAFSNLEGLTIRGAKWPLEQADIPFGESLTLSNEVSGTLKVGLSRGQALLYARTA